jgi:LPXTG-motif cell wall-anchored protein
MRKITAVTIGALFALLPAGALADEAPTDTLTQAVAPAPADPAPADSSSQEQAAPEPAATPAQEDVSGGNEYSEEVPPTGTGEPDDTSDTNSDDTEDTTTSQPAPTGGGTTSGSDVAATEATETGAEEGGLPRTGADSWIIALIGVALLGCGIVVRRAALSQR